ncbi:Cop9 signalosome complex subunit 8 isoform 2 [Theobroma cacao]|uniref:Cop9 signalosome complex subunit 8 isoform 2 n=1 Tax=Theobroma cacao TaxID=3641 RepID=A0A061GB05_THECC|nr:Cop9 signalosome complex subunit 8 isoform 2 [Theobroma cacao]
MDFSVLNGALASKSFNRIADICDNLMLQVAAEGVAFQDEWPFAIHLLGHIYVDDINSARFLWKSIPAAIKESQPELVAAWKIGQKLWTRDYAGVYDAIRGFDWSQETQVLVASFSELYTKRMFGLLLSAYSTISIQDAAQFLGMSEDDATNYIRTFVLPVHAKCINLETLNKFGKDALRQGWTVDPVSQMLTVKKQAIVREQKLDPGKLQCLTEYVFHLEH